MLRILNLMAILLIAWTFSVQAETHLVLLGTGTPGAEPDRSGPAVAVVAGATAYLVDCGPGVVRQANAACEKGILPLHPVNLNLAFITHLHSDHTVGYPDLILSPWVLGRKVPLRVFGPPGVKKMTEHLLEAYSEDSHIRSTGLERNPLEGVRVIATEIEPGVVYEDELMKVTAFPVQHGDWKHAFGYKFEGKDRTIVISGDTKPTEALVKAARDCDVLVHEVYGDKVLAHSPESVQKYHRESHTSAEDLGKIAAEVKPGLLVLYHLLPFGMTEEELLQDIRKNYSGKVVIGRDLEVY